MKSVVNSQPCAVQHNPLHQALTSSKSPLATATLTAFVCWSLHPTLLFLQHCNQWNLHFILHLLEVPCHRFESLTYTIESSCTYDQRYTSHHTSNTIPSSSLSLSAYAMIGSEELSSIAHDWKRRRWEQILFHSLLIFFLLHLVDTIGWFTLDVICPKGLLSGWYFETDKRIALKWWLTKYLIKVFPVWCGLRFRCPFPLHAIARSEASELRR